MPGRPGRTPASVQRERARWAAQHPEEARWQALGRVLWARLQREEALRVAELDVVQAIAEARALGVTWEQIGEALGVTRQGAVKRYGAA